MNDYKNEYTSGWIGVDLDGTLAEYHGWKGERHIGKPIPAMVDRVKAWIDRGIEVRILTARASKAAIEEGLEFDWDASIAAIEKWCVEVFGIKIQITAEKDFHMIELWDDRAVSVEFNTGKIQRSQRSLLWFERD